MRRRVYMIHIVGKYKGSEGEGVAIMEFRMGGGDTKLICNTLWVKWIWLQKNLHNKESQWIGLSIRLSGYSCDANENYLNTFQLESTEGI